MSLRDWLRRQVGEVPPADAVCEFRCHRTSCRHGEWERCETRLRGGRPIDLPQADEGSANPAAGSP